MCIFMYLYMMCLYPFTCKTDMSHIKTISRDTTINVTLIRSQAYLSHKQETLLLNL